MKVIINGEEQILVGSLTLAELLKKFSIDTDKVAIEHNREIIPCSLFNTVKIADGDELELVQFIGGG